MLSNNVCVDPQHNVQHQSASEIENNSPSCQF